MRTQIQRFLLRISEQVSFNIVHSTHPNSLLIGGNNSNLEETKTKQELPQTKIDRKKELQEKKNFEKLNTMEAQELSQIEQEQMEVLKQISLREEEERKKIEDEEERILREVLELSRKENEEELKKHEMSEKEKMLQERENKLKEEEERLKKKKKKLNKKKKEFETKLTEKANTEQTVSVEKQVEIQKPAPVVSPEVIAPPVKVPVVDKPKKTKHTVIAQNIEKKPEPAVSTVHSTATNGSDSVSKGNFKFCKFQKIKMHNCLINPHRLRPPSCYGQESKRRHEGSRLRHSQSSHRGSIQKST